MKMRVGINVCAYDHRPSGAKQRFVALFEQLFADQNHEYLVFEARDAPMASNFSASRVEFCRTILPSRKTLQRTIVGEVYWRHILRKRKVDVFDTSGLSWVPNPCGVTFHTLHDIRHVTHPEMYSTLYRVVSRHQTRATLRHADVVITVSETMKRQLLEFEPSARVAVLPNAIDWDEKADDVRVVTAPYLLAVGHLERRKNYLRLIDAFERVSNRGYVGELHIIGNASDDAARISVRILRSNVGHKIRLHADVPWTDMKRYYRYADLFILPSLYEGFGIPILEAMSFGCPFTLSNLPVFREVTGGKALYFEPTDPADMADKITRMLASTTLRDACGGIATECRGVYSWKKTAELYLRLLRKFE